MPLYNKIQLTYLLNNLNSKKLPKKSNPEEDQVFIRNFISVMEKVIGHTDLDLEYRANFIETFIKYLQ